MENDLMKLLLGNQTPKTPSVVRLNPTAKGVDPSKKECATAFAVDPANPHLKAVDGVLFTSDMKTLIAYPPLAKAKSFCLPKETAEIAKEAFRGARYLKKVEIAGVRALPKNVFSDCESLEEVILGQPLESLGYGAFLNDGALKRIVLPKGVKEIGDQSFVGPGAVEVYSFDTPADFASIKHKGDLYEQCAYAGLMVAFYSEKGPLDQQHDWWFMKDGACRLYGKRLSEKPLFTRDFDNIIAESEDGEGKSLSMKQILDFGKVYAPAASLYTVVHHPIAYRAADVSDYWYDFVLNIHSEDPELLKDLATALEISEDYQDLDEKTLYYQGISTKISLEKFFEQKKSILDACLSHRAGSKIVLSLTDDREWANGELTYDGKDFQGGFVLPFYPAHREAYWASCRYLCQIATTEKGIKQFHIRFVVNKD